MKKFFVAVFALVMLVASSCFAGEIKDRLVQKLAESNNPNLKTVQVYIECSSIWEQKTLNEFQAVLEKKFPRTHYKLIFSPEFAAAVEIRRDEEPFFTSTLNKSMAVRTEDWVVLTKSNPCDYVMYCKLIRGDVKAKLNYNVLFFTTTTKVEMDCTLRIFNVAKGAYTYATKYRTVGKAHNTSNFERAERTAVIGAFQSMNFNPNII